MILHVLATAGLTTLLYFSRVFVIFTPLPILVSAFKKGVSGAIASWLISSALVAVLYAAASRFHFLASFVGGPVNGSIPVFGFQILQFSYFAWLAFVMALVGRSEFRRETGFAIIAGAGLALPVIITWIFARKMGVDLTQEIRESLATYYDQMVQMRLESSGSSDQVLLLQQDKEANIRRMMQMMPAMWTLMTFMTISLNVMIARRIAAAEGAFKSWKEFPLWRLDERAIWVPIVVGSLYFLNVYLVHHGWLHAVLLNALILVCSVYLFQGLAVASFFAHTKAPWLRSIFIYFFAAIFFYVAIPVLVAIGLFDFWFDFRKLKKLL